jgi:hypothetical protein
MNLMSGGSGSTKIAKRWARVAGSGLGQKAQGHTMTTWQQDMAGQLSKPRCKKVQQKKVQKKGSTGAVVQFDLVHGAAHPQAA